MSKVEVPGGEGDQRKGCQKAGMRGCGVLEVQWSYGNPET